MSSIVTEQPIAVSIARASALTSLSKSTIRASIRHGRLRAVKIGRRVLVPIEAIHQFLSESAATKAA